MKYVIVFNSGSSSLKFSLYNNSMTILEGLIDSINLKNPNMSWKIFSKNEYKNYSKKLKTINHNGAFDEAFSIIFSIVDKKKISGIGHRVVHGGNYYFDPVIINKNVLRNLKKISYLAPLHNPHNIEGIEICSKKIKNIKQVAVFDTGFHKTLNHYAKIYPLPKKILKKYHIRKYGFHGISYSYIVDELRRLKRNEIINDYKKTIICHMGNGISITALKDGKSVQTSMGFTPLDGMPMGTRIGSIDPGLILFLIEKGYSVRDMEKILNKKSGLLAISGSSDMRKIHEKAVRGDKKSKEAISFMAYNAFEIIGSYIAVLNGLDILVFTGGIGERAYYLRSKIVSHLSYMGARLDPKNNKKNELLISHKKSKIKILKIHTNEDLKIAKETIKLIS